MFCGLCVEAQKIYGHMLDGRIVEIIDVLSDSDIEADRNRYFLYPLHSSADISAPFWDYFTETVEPYKLLSSTWCI
jgi:hypothetical protein